MAPANIKLGGRSLQQLTTLSHIKSLPKWSFTQRPADKPTSHNYPSPGAYNIKSTFDNNDTPKYKFSKSSRNEAKREDIPGPGAYAPNLHPNSPFWSLSKKFSDERINLFVPGPGAYDPLSTSWETVRSSKFGSSQRRALSVPIQSPAPGTYYPKFNDTSYYFTMAPRLKPPQTNERDNLGPGSYSIPESFISGPKYTLTGRGNMKYNANIVPGPGSYETREKIGSGALCYSIAKKLPGTSHINATSSQVPGPGAYSLESNVPFTHSSQWRFGTEKRDEQFLKTADAPGPGNYHEGKQASSSPHWSFGLPPKVKSARDGNPGPGTYPMNTNQFSGPRYTIAPKLNCNGSTTEKDLPGPGKYDPKILSDSLAIKWSFSHSGRPTATKETGVPGPGTYTVSTKSTGPLWSIGSRAETPIKESLATERAPMYTSFGY
ncbi:putative H-SHIPPO 1 [Cardiosporidium cionae]|uniref:H-SHIPPO 1 n=1 Tax=Cardiosporidium cionae TaxID=476202 RepID=A0ABQ7JEY3_9APIC|nr:putative H-SHIPPO 1 [Cardiosporidium cionae]|eukprot:KAF8822450.1 putative H-SHIPPO 1 [Cardiosporidium cionae]